MENKEQSQLSKSNILTELKVQKKKKKFFTMLMVKNGNRLPKAVVESLFLEMLKVSLVKVLYNLHQTLMLILL